MLLYPILLATLASTAMAGGKATLAAPSQGAKAVQKSIHITWRDADDLRMDTNGDSSYFLVRDGKAYTVTHVGGSPRVMDMTALRMMQGKSGKSAAQQGKDAFGNIDSIKPTGKTETVAGVKGRIYHMTWTKPDGAKKSADAVLTDNPLIVGMTRAYFNSVGAMFGSRKDTQSFQHSLPGRDRGLPRVGDSFRVKSVKEADPPDSMFKLPAKPMDMEQLMRGMGGDRHK